MTFSDIKKEASCYRNALMVERFISAPALRRLERAFFHALSVALGLWILALLFGAVPLFRSAVPELAELSLRFLPFLTGAAGLAFSLWSASAALFAFFASSYFKDLEHTVDEPLWGKGKRPGIRYEAAAALGRGEDALADFFASRFGLSVAWRLGISSAAVMDFLRARPRPMPWESIPFADGAAPLSLGDLAAALSSSSGELRRFLQEQSVSPDDFAAAASWVSRGEEGYKRAARFWGRDSLGRIRGIGKNWAFGETTLLERYAVEIDRHPACSTAEGASRSRETEEVERILSRRREANALLVGEAGVSKVAVLCRLATMIRGGTVLPPLEHKRIFVCHGPLFVSAMKERALFERELIRLLAEAATAGNIILAFDEFDRMLESARSIGSDMLALIDDFLASPAVQIAATAESGAYRALLEPNPRIKERFELVRVSGAGVAGTISVLEDEAPLVERREGVFYTYQALKECAISADRYFPETVLPDKAIDLLAEAAPEARRSGERIITAEAVRRIVSRKTGISLSAASEAERAKLLALPDILHRRVVGQDEAISSIAGALRRARSGVGDPNRPMGSFLFLGPTGVGKTETAKALAEALFGDEKSITRFDMSEFSAPDALSRFIGTFEGGQPGKLSSAIRERPFGVLLLDEFEKTNKDIHDLFLQILDEGFFTDAKGSRVNARNLMIIATSNAGSDMIWKAVQDGKPLSRDAVISELIGRGMFRPELLNRFDGIILFHPLRGEHLKHIARLQLQKLARRLREKGIELAIADPLIDYLVSVGQDPKFGARPMNRAIAEKVEQRIAERFLRGELRAGDRVEFSAAELAE